MALGTALKAAGHSVTIFKIESAPHDWLFPRVRAVVHHGGAGTTAAGLRAGKPMIICPFMGDQPFWGRRVCELGVGPPPIRQKRLSADKLARALLTVTENESMTTNAKDLGNRIRSENGTANSIAVIEQILQQHDNN